MKKAVFCFFLFISFFQNARSQSVSFEVQAGLSSAIRKILPFPGGVCIATVQGDLVLWDPSRNRIDSRLNIEKEIYDLAYLQAQDLIAVSTPSEVFIFETTSGKLEPVASFTCDNPTALYYSGKNLFVATREKFVELEIDGAEIRPLRQVAKNENPSYTFRIRGNRIWEASNLGFHIYSMEGASTITDEPEEVSEVDTSSVAEEKENPVEPATVIASLREFHTGWYAYTWDEENNRLYFPSEASLKAIDFSSATLSSEMIFPVAKREELITGLTLVGTDLFMGNRSGYLYKFPNSAKTGPGQPVRTASASLTHLAVLSGLLTIGDFYGNISLYDPGSLEEIFSLNDESTPAINAVFLDGKKRMVTTHKDPSGAYLSVWDIRTASLIKRQRFLTQQIIGVSFIGDSIRTTHADGASYWISDSFDTTLISPSLLPYEPAFGMNLLDKDPMLIIQGSRSELREALLRPAAYKWKDGPSGAEIIYTVPPPTVNCERMPPYELVQSIFRETGLSDYLQNWDLMDQDILFMKACRSPEQVFLQYLKSKSIPIDLGLQLHKRLHSTALPRLSILGQKKGDTLYTIRKNGLQFLSFHDEIGQWVLFFPDSVVLVDATTRKSRGVAISALPLFFHYALTDSVLAITSTGKTTIYEIDKPGKRTSWLSFGADQYLVHNKEGFYRLKGRSTKLVGFEGKEMKEFAYFDLKYNRPDILLAELNGQESEEAKAFTAVVAKRLNRQGMKKPVWLKSPSVNYQLPLFCSTGNLDVQYPGKFRELVIWVNGTLEKNKAIRQIQLSPGLNKIELHETDRTGDTIFHSDIQYVFSPRPARTRHFYFGAGINECRDDRLNLQYAVKDIDDISDKLSKRIPGIVVNTLFNDKVGAEGYLEWRKMLEKTSVDDVVLVSLSGHGYLDKDSSFHFASGASTMDRYQSSISYDSLLYLLDAAPARRKLLLIDACHSGLTDTESESANLPPGVKAKTLRKKQDAASSTKAFRMMQEEFLDLTKHNGTIVIAAAGGAEFALETADHKNGLFTYALIKGLFEGLADMNNDKHITTTELQEYLGKEVLRLSRGGQKPSTNQDNQGLEWKIL